MNLFSIEIVYLFPEVTVAVVKWIFCYKEGVLMETDLFPAILCRYWIFYYNEWRYKEFWLYKVLFAGPFMADEHYSSKAMSNPM